MLLPKSQRNHMFPSRCIQDPCRNIEVTMCDICAPGSVRHATLSPMGNDEPGGSDIVSSPGISPRLHTDSANAKPLPAPCTSSHANVHAATSASVTYGVRCVSFSS